MKYPATVIDIEKRISRTETPYWNVTVKEESEVFPYIIPVYSNQIIESISVGDVIELRVRAGRYNRGEVSISI